MPELDQEQNFQKIKDYIENNVKSGNEPMQKEILSTIELLSSQGSSILSDGSVKEKKTILELIQLSPFLQLKQENMKKIILDLRLGHNQAQNIDFIENYFNKIQTLVTLVNQNSKDQEQELDEVDQEEAMKNSVISNYTVSELNCQTLSKIKSDIQFNKEDMNLKYERMTSNYDRIEYYANLSQNIMNKLQRYEQVGDLDFKKDYSQSNAIHVLKVLSKNLNYYSKNISYCCQKYFTDQPSIGHTIEKDVNSQINILIYNLEMIISKFEFNEQ